MKKLPKAVKKAVKKIGKVYKRVVDNKMRWYGDYDEKTKIIRVNKSKKKNKKRGDIIDTIIHEEKHATSPRMHEKNVRKYAKKAIKRMSAKMKQKLYSRYS